MACHCDGVVWRGIFLSPSSGKEASIGVFVMITPRTPSEEKGVPECEHVACSTSSLHAALSAVVDRHGPETLI